MSVIAKRYAQALWNLSEQNSAIDQIHRDVLLILNSLEHRHFLEILSSPVLRAIIKKNICLAVFGKKIQIHTLDFLNLLADKKRLNILKDIMQVFLNLYQKKNQIYPIELITASALEVEMKQKLEKQLNTHYSKIVPIYKINPHIIGGLIINIIPENKQINLSVRKKLIQIRQTLMQAS